MNTNTQILLLKYFSTPIIIMSNKRFSMEHQPTPFFFYRIKDTKIKLIKYMFLQRFAPINLE